MASPDLTLVTLREQFGRLNFSTRRVVDVVQTLQLFNGKAIGIKDLRDSVPGIDTVNTIDLLTRGKLLVEIHKQENGRYLIGDEFNDVPAAFVDAQRDSGLVEIVTPEKVQEFQNSHPAWQRIGIGDLIDNLGLDYLLHID